MLKRRLEQLEKNDNRQEPLVIIGCYVEPNGEERPATGYSFGDTQLHRKAGESNEELEARAEAAIRSQAPKGTGVLILEPIQQEDPCEA